MAVYTCYEMISDCRANKREGWTYFARNYLPITRGLWAHYFPSSATCDERDRLRALCQADAALFDKPVPEREFVAKLRQHALAVFQAGGQAAPADALLDVEAMTAALGEFSPLERQVVWMMTMRYGVAAIATTLRMDAKTAGNVRERALEALRQHLDRWNRDILETNGLALGREAEEAKAENCIPARSFLDLLDGKMTWQRKEDMEFHLKSCWHCVDHISRLREVDELLRHNQPEPEERAAYVLDILGFPPQQKKGLWRRLRL